MLSSMSCSSCVLVKVCSALASHSDSGKLSLSHDTYPRWLMVLRKLSSSRTRSELCMHSSLHLFRNSRNSCCVMASQVSNASVWCVEEVFSSASFDLGCVSLFRMMFSSASLSFILKEGCLNSETCRSQLCSEYVLKCVADTRE
jgi:hypothetical protein